MKIAILDYGAGNIRSVQNALERLGQEFFVSGDPKELLKADKLIFPGVGSAGFAMRRLKETGLDIFLKNYTKPVLGICLGMQLFFDFSEEDATECLGIIPGRIQKFDIQKSKIVPHMGWNRICSQLTDSGQKLFENIDQDSFVYFVHSYFAPITEDTIAECFYGERFTAAVQKDNFWGAQFHPEKSGDIGEQILRNFLNVSLNSNDDVSTEFELGIARFRPCIDIHDGQVKQIIGSTLMNGLQTNFVSQYSPSFFAEKYKKDGLLGGHIVMLDCSPETEKVTIEALQIFPKGLHIGGGITEKNAQKFLDAGASKVIVSSYIFKDGKLNIEKLKKLSEIVGKERLVLDLSCRKKNDSYIVVTDKWETFTNLEISKETVEMLEKFVSEFLVHGVDQEGKQSGIEESLICILAECCTLPVVYAGGVQNREDIELINKLGKGKIDFTVGSALDLFGGDLSYKKIVEKNCNFSLPIRIIPCLDVKNGRTVKGVNFVDFQDVGDPVELGKFYSDEGADELVFLDIGATLENRKTFTELVERIAKEINIPFTVGGGIQTIDDISTLLRCGADKVSLGSVVVKNPELVSIAAEQFGSQCVVISVDAKRRKEGAGWEIYIKGGTENTGLDAIEFSKKMCELGAGELLVNSLDRDGTKSGYDNELLRSITEVVNIPVIASSGVGKMEDFVDGVKKGKVSAVLAATLFHFGEMRICEVKEFMQENGGPVRL